ncbi:GTP-binding protein Rheb homolog 1-like [Haliotis rubra]|uniref:GTP-binding protein Rheb homolog 1-like n=1 Tax=Haliotis rubra TaxID=36100 RepID=UPI001EE51AD1|nr:GTP-binding protein Rheb homolog 1-like [Haliotis rubra]
MAQNCIFRQTCRGKRDAKSLNVLVMGGDGVGKRTLISRLMDCWKKTATSISQLATDDILGIGGKTLDIRTQEASTGRMSFLQRIPTSDVYLLIYSMIDDASFQIAVSIRERILAQKGPNVPIVFVANKTDIGQSVDQIERVYRDLNISCEWENGHVEISAEKDESVYKVLEQILKRYKKYVGLTSRTERTPENPSRFQAFKKLFFK